MLQIARSVVGQAASLCGFEEDEAQFIILAVDEACANVIRHAYGGRADGQITLRCSLKEDRVEFVLLDHGRPAAADSLRPRSLDEVRPGGLGLHLIQSLMDEVHYESGQQGNRLFLAKLLRPRQRVQTGAAKE